MGFLDYVVIPPFHCPMILVVSTCNSVVCVCVHLIMLGAVHGKVVLVLF